jgi:hypothetical protein
MIRESILYNSYYKMVKEQQPNPTSSQEKSPSELNSQLIAVLKSLKRSGEREIAHVPDITEFLKAWNIPLEQFLEDLSKPRREAGHQYANLADQYYQSLQQAYLGSGCLSADTLAEMLGTDETALQPLLDDLLQKGDVGKRLSINYPNLIVYFWNKPLTTEDEADVTKGNAIQLPFMLGIATEFGWLDESDE